MFPVLCLILLSVVAVHGGTNIGLKRMGTEPDEGSILSRDTASSILASTPMTTTKHRTKSDTLAYSVLASKTTKTTRSLPTAKNHVAQLDLSTSFQNKTFLPLVIDGQDVPISCLNCSTSGTLHVSGTDLQVGTDFADSSDSIDFQGGLFEAQLPHGLEGRIELAVAAPSSLSHTFNLLTLPVVGFAVPKLADAGVWLNISVLVGVEILLPAFVSFGLEFGVPENASITIDVGDRRNSTVKGFDDEKNLTLNALPVHVSEPGLDARITASLVLDIAIGAKMLDNDLVANVGAAVQIPKFSATERQLDNVDSKCNPIKNGTATTPQAHQTPRTTAASGAATLVPGRGLIGNYTNIIPAVGIDVSVYVETGLTDVFGGHDFSLRDEVNIFDTMLRQSTICINNHKPTKTSSVNSTSTAIATSSTHSNSRATTNPTQTRGTAVATSLESSAALWHSSKDDLDSGSLLAGGRMALLALAVAMTWLVVGF